MTGQQPPGPTLSTLKLLVFALAMGMMLLPVAATFIHLQGSGPAAAPPAPPMRDIMLLVLAGYAPAMLIGAFILRAVMTARARRSLDSIQDEEERRARAMDLFGTMTILVCAMVESAGLFGGVTYLLTARPLTLAPVALALIAMALLIPSEGRFRAFYREASGRFEV